MSTEATVAAVEPVAIAALLWAVGEQPSEQLPDLAADALARGLDTPSLRELAGLPADDHWAIKDLFEITLVELGIEMLDEQDALWRLAQHKAQEIVDGLTSPSAGAHWIWWRVRTRIEREGDLRVFVGLADEWDDHPAHRDELELAIVDAARQLVQQPAPRRWLRLQATRGTSPVMDSGTRAELTFEDLSVSPSLSEAMSAWAATYDATFASQPEGFPSKEAAHAFVQRGVELSDWLQTELGDGWHVEYYPEPVEPPGVRLQASDS